MKANMNSKIYFLVLFSIISIASFVSSSFFNNDILYSDTELYK